MFDANHLVSAFGLLGVLAIVFAESGLLIGFFLPGDSVLFTAGLLISQHQVIHQPLWLVCLLISVASILGNQVGYVFGRRAGPALFRRPNSRLFKQEYVTKAHDFFERHGPKALVLARFVPVVRTFTPILAGVSGMTYRAFTVFNVLGGVLWGAGVTVAGYFLGQIGFIRDHIDVVLVAIIVVSVLPAGIEALRARRRTPVRSA
ncbi:DedA family protein [Actinacidiphila soli]|uniref:DedA family protein n=1 Tax=Actinacidiphila soli TaxID=2487275 RepID=UPI000FCC0AFB|nr:VTT domain-containing protein [Actinacidiphila soli]